MIAPLSDRERSLLVTLCNARAGTQLTLSAEVGEVLRRTNALLEQYERIAPEEGRRVWAAAFTDALRDRKLSLADARELSEAKEQADIALGIFNERFGGGR